MIEISEHYWENLIGILGMFTLLALAVERALYQIFDSKLWRRLEKYLEEQVGGDYLDLKPWISVIVSLVIAFQLKVDVIATILRKNEPEILSMVLTGFFLAGGSTGIYKFLKRARKLKDTTA
ncbi:MAG: hypothetical protein F7O42_01910 [Opitutae bacterium]|nr:hypothetical protein [Opitutae bacterium]